MNLPEPLEGVSWLLESGGPDGPWRLSTDQAGGVALATLSIREVGNDRRVTLDVPEAATWELDEAAALVRWALREGRARLGPDALPGWIFRVDTVDVPEAGRAILANEGMDLAVAEVEMERALARSAPLQLREGAELVPWSDSLAAQFHEVYNDAFRTRPGFPGWDEATWRSHLVASRAFRPDLSLLLFVNSEPAAYSVNWVEDGLGWVIQMGVRQRFRRQGLGRLLLERSCERFFDAGLEHAALSVNVNNPEARRLYEEAGFVAMRRYESYRKPLT